MFAHTAPNQRLAINLAVGFALIYLAFLPPGIYSLDGNSMLAVAESIVTRHDITVPTGLGSPGIDGRIYSDWYPMLSILAVPFTFIASIVSRIAHVPFHFLAAVMACSLSCLFTAGAAGTTALLALHLGSSQKGAWLAAISFGLGTVALTYARSFYTEPLMSLLFASALLLAFARTPGKIAGAACLAALVVLTKPPGVVLGPVLTCYLFLKRLPLRLCALPTVGTFAGFGIYAVYNVYRYGNPFKFVGPPRLFYASTIPTALAGLTVSPAWGVIWYCPAVVVAAYGFYLALRASRAEAFGIVGLFLALLLLYSSWEFWWGGWSWGSRFLMPALPGFCALTGLLEGKWRRALIILSAAGFLINAPTLFSFYERYYAELNEAGIPVEANLTWSVKEAPVLHAWPAAVREAEDASRSSVVEIFRQRGAPSSTIENSRALRIVAIWWWVLPVAGIPRWIGIVLSLLLIAAGVFFLFRSRLELPD